MAVQVIFEQPIFWKPVNAIGVAASVHGEVDGNPITANLYWTSMLLATRPEGSDAEALQREARGFLAAYHPKSTKEPVQHFVFTGDEFRKIVDPKWVPGQ